MAQPPHTPLPPALADQILRLFCPSDLHEELLGDLHEQFEQQVTQIGESTARRLYIWEVIRFCRPYLISRRLRLLMADLNTDLFHSFLHPDMLRNYFKIAWRNLIKDKQFTLLNVLGLSAGLACALLILLWVGDELSYDKMFSNDERLYKLFEQGGNSNGEVYYSEESSRKLGDVVKQSVPGVE